MQYHHKKNECGYIIKGRLKIIYDNGNGKLQSRIIGPGKSFHFPPGIVHQEYAITDVQIIEASTPHFNDRVRVEKKYGLNMNGGLPTTKKKSVIQK